MKNFCRHTLLLLLFCLPVFTASAQTRTVRQRIGELLQQKKATGGIDSVSGYLRRIGARGFALSQTEDDMHRDIRNSYKNRSRPSATVLLLRRALEGSLLRPDHRDFLRDCLIATSTGPDKLKGMLPEGSVVAHKTGSSDRTAQGVKIADNDIGMILLPDGRRCFVAVLIKDSQQSDAENAALIARIARIVYDELNGSESAPPPLPGGNSRAGRK